MGELSKAPLSAEELFEAAQQAHFRVLTVGAQVTEHYLTTNPLPEQRHGQPGPEDDPEFQAAQAEFALARNALSHHFDR